MTETIFFVYSMILRYKNRLLRFRLDNYQCRCLKISLFNCGFSAEMFFRLTPIQRKKTQIAITSVVGLFLKSMQNSSSISINQLKYLLLLLLLFERVQLLKYDFFIRFAKLPFAQRSAGSTCGQTKNSKHQHDIGMNE